MLVTAFNAKCPFQIGDKVKDGRTGLIHSITDIACMHFLRTGRIQFSYELDNSGQYVLIDGEGPEVNER